MNSLSYKKCTHTKAHTNTNTHQCSTIEEIFVLVPKNYAVEHVGQEVVKPNAYLTLKLD